MVVASNKRLRFRECFGKGEMGEGFDLGSERVSVRVRSKRALSGFGFSV